MSGHGKEETSKISRLKYPGSKISRPRYFSTDALSSIGGSPEPKVLTPPIFENKSDIESHLDTLYELCQKIMHSQGKHGHGMENVLEEEMNRVKTLVKDVTRDRIQYEAEMKRQQQSAAELKIKCSGYQQQIATTKKLLQNSEDHVKELENRLSESQTMQAVSESENKLLHNEMQDLQKALDNSSAKTQCTKNEHKSTPAKRQVSQGLQEQVEEKITGVQNGLTELQRSLENLACQRKKAYDSVFIKCKRELAAVKLPVESLKAFISNQEKQETPAAPDETKLLKRKSPQQTEQTAHDGIGETDYSTSSSQEVTSCYQEADSSDSEVASLPHHASWCALLILLFPVLLFVVLFNWRQLELYL